jgi:hypothetical protein
MASARTTRNGCCAATTPPRPTRPPPPRPAGRTRARRAEPCAVAIAAAIATLLPAAAVAQPPDASNGSSASTSRVLEVRLGLAAGVGKVLSEPRVRRLLEIELGDDGVLGPGTAGPLGDHVAYVWVDSPSPTLLGVEVRVADRPVVRREIPIAGVGPDVAARLVAIAAGELVREKPRSKRPTPQPTPAPEEQELARRGRPALELAAEGSVAGVPRFGGAIAGPGLGASFRALGLSEGLFARWMEGAGRGGAARWLEIGVAVDYRHWLGARVRLVGGASAALASLRLADAVAVDGAAGDRDAWSARAGLRLGAEARVATSLWLGLVLEPGVVLRPVRFTDAGGAPQVAEGAWLGAALGLRFERPFSAGDPHP